jgi:uncharacterized protein with ATP-grasp and redox domains
MGARSSLDDERRPRSTMRTTLDCVPCFARQALEAARFAADDEATRRSIVREALAMLAAETDLDQSPPQIGQRIHRLVRQLAGHDDPYGALKDRSNAAALAALPALARSCWPPETPWGPRCAWQSPPTSSTPA